MGRARRQAVLLLALSLACLLASGPPTSLARFASTNVNGGDSFTAGRWIYYLHNNPTPPTGNTTAQVNLTATATASTTATLYNYDTDNANRPGRGLTRANPPSAGLTTAYRYVNWRMPALAMALLLSGNVTADIWSATNTATANRTGSLIAYLRDYNPATGLYAEIANGTYTGAYAAGRTYYERPITVNVAPAYTLPIGHQLELKIESPQATSQNNMLVAYDTTLYPAFVQLR